MANNVNTGLDVVTGAFGFTGRHIAQRLLDSGRSVRTLTGRSQIHGSPQDPFHGRLETLPFNFQDSHALTESLEGVDTLYNTYWVRFASGEVTFERAVENSRSLVNAAVAAGVKRLVHISITNPSEDSPLPYFRGKALVERAMKESGISHAILRPALVFGEGDILLNNIAWALRRFPVFPVAGDGHYRAQPVYVGDLADMAIAMSNSWENITMDAVGPEIYTFDELIYQLEKSVGSRAKIAHMPSYLALSLSRVVGYFVRDIVLTRQEIDGLVASLLVSAEPPSATTLLSDWLSGQGSSLGQSYASEMDRHYRTQGRGHLGN